MASHFNRSVVHTSMKAIQSNLSRREATQVGDRGQQAADATVTRLSRSPHLRRTRASRSSGQKSRGARIEGFAPTWSASTKPESPAPKRRQAVQAAALPIPNRITIERSWWRTAGRPLRRKPVDSRITDNPRLLLEAAAQAPPHRSVGGCGRGISKVAGGGCGLLLSRDQDQPPADSLREHSTPIPHGKLPRPI